jgi:hypothetical protein
MATQKGGYFLKDGTRVPSVTTVIGRFKEAGGLIHWAWKLGKEGKDYREVRDEAADAGTMAHEAVEAWIHGLDYVFDGPDEITSKAKRSFEAFLEWASQTELKVTETEVAMISESYKFGGTPDAFTIRGKRACLDWKSSNAIYGEYLVQVAAYGQLWDENHPGDHIVGGFHLLRFDKTYGDFHHHYWGELDSAWEAFKHLRALYDIDRELKARAK